MPKSRPVSKFKAFLNTPLLSGEAAEKWSLNFVARPALLIGAVASGCAAYLTLGGVGATALAVASYFRLPHRVMEASVKNLMDLFSSVEKIVVSPKKSSQKTPKREGYRRIKRQLMQVLEGYVQAAPVKDLGYFRPLRSWHTMAGLDISRNPPQTLPWWRPHYLISLNLPNIWRIGMRPRSVLRQGQFIAAHEYAHYLQFVPEVKRSNYVFAGLSHVSADFSPTVLLLAAGGLVKSFSSIPLSEFSLGALNLALQQPLVLGGLSALAGEVARRVYVRQGEYAADRKAIRETQDLRAGVSVMMRPDVTKNPRQPILLRSVIATHPCSYNRIREMRTYWAQLAAKGVKQQVTPPPEYRPNPQSAASTLVLRA